APDALEIIGDVAASAFKAPDLSVDCLVEVPATESFLEKRLFALPKCAEFPLELGPLLRDLCRSGAEVIGGIDSAQGRVGEVFAVQVTTLGACIAFGRHALDLSFENGQPVTSDPCSSQHESIAFGHERLARVREFTSAGL